MIVILLFIITCHNFIQTAAESKHDKQDLELMKRELYQRLMELPELLLRYEMAEDNRAAAIVDTVLGVITALHEFVRYDVKPEKKTKFAGANTDIQTLKISMKKLVVTLKEYKLTIRKVMHNSSPLDKAIGHCVSWGRLDHEELQRELNITLEEKEEEEERLITKQNVWIDQQENNRYSKGKLDGQMNIDTGGIYRGKGEFLCEDVPQSNPSMPEDWLSTKSEYMPISALGTRPYPLYLYNGQPWFNIRPHCFVH